MSEYILVKGDVSGIQDFIFNVKSKEAAKELKGRSFFNKLLVEVAMLYLFDKAGIVDNNINDHKISTSGGNFIIKLPKDKTDIVQNAQKVFTEALQYTGLNIAIDWVDYDENNYGASIQKLNAKIRERKLKFYANDISFFSTNKKADYKNGFNWNNLTTQLKQTILGKKTFKIETDSNAIKTTVGHVVKIAGYKITFNVDKDIDHIRIFDLENYLESLFPLDINNNIKPFASDKYEQQTLVKSDVLRYIKSENRCIKTINGGQSGISKLGILAMDVDGLGTVIENLSNEDEHKKFDQKLRHFFNNRLREIINDINIYYYKDYSCRNEKVPKYKDKIYTVTAGGDDSFFVGKWNTILELAQTINKEFDIEFNNKFRNEFKIKFKREYNIKKDKNGNLKFKRLTISAGFIMVDPKFPVVRFAELAESALKKAKYKYNTKGNICIFDEVVQWDKLKEIIDLRNYFRRALKDKFTNGKLTKARTAFLPTLEKNTLSIKDFWQLAYYLRDLKESKNKIKGKINTFLTESIKANDKLTKRNWRLIMPIAARLAEFDKRK